VQALSPQRREAAYPNPLATLATPSRVAINPRDDEDVFGAAPLTPRPLATLATPSRVAINPHDDEDVFRAAPLTPRVAGIAPNYGTPGTPSQAVNAPTPMPDPPPPSYNQFTNPPANPSDWVPAHRRHHYGGRIEHLIHFSVPDDTRTALPSKFGVGKGWKVKKWYVVMRGYDVGIFFDYWYVQRAIYYACALIRFFRGAIAPLVADGGRSKYCGAANYIKAMNIFMEEEVAGNVRSLWMA
jgi:hypothetical protein